MKEADPQGWRSITGEPGDGDETGQPERPYIHDYTKSLVMKVFLSEPGETEGESRIALTLEQLLALIKKLDVLTRQMPKIIYLVGWQYNGHDDKYPAFFEVNPRLKREGDSNAAESLVWLMKEAYRCHTVVSLHINMTDAYQDSPLWEEYCAKGLIARKKDGSLMDIGEWGYFRKKTAYQINYEREWESGCAVERIDRLLACLPLERAGTIHIDAWFARESLDTELETERAARRKVCRYFRERGIDVTTEFLFGDGAEGGQECPADGTGSGIIGLIPYFWHFNQSHTHYVRRPPQLLTGAAANPDIPYGSDKDTGFLFGESIRGEDIFFQRRKGYCLNPDWEEEFKKQFCLHTLLWAYRNQFERKELRVGRIGSRMFHQGGIQADTEKKEILRNGQPLYRNGDVFVPVFWKEEPEVLAYSTQGYQEREWYLPEGFESAVDVTAAELTADGTGGSVTIPVEKGKIRLAMEAGQMLAVTAGKPETEKGMISSNASTCIRLDAEVL